MNKLFQTLSMTLSMIAALALFVVACSPQSAQAAEAAQAAPSAASYQTVLGKPVSDNSVADFIASNKCFSSSQFQLCRAAGMALWIDPAQKINTVYLYAESENGFAPYEGELPFDLTFKDSMADVEQKFGQPKVPQARQAGWEPGLPDAGSSPDHIHYWAVYERFGVTIVYNTPFANDKNASIHSILVTK